MAPRCVTVRKMESAESLTEDFERLWRAWPSGRGWQDKYQKEEALAVWLMVSNEDNLTTADTDTLLVVIEEMKSRSLPRQFGVLHYPRSLKEWILHRGWDDPNQLDHKKTHLDFSSCAILIGIGMLLGWLLLG